MVTTRKAVPPTCHLESKGDNIKQVNTFRYLGYSISSNGKCLQEVKTRIAKAKDTFNQMKAITKNKCISVETKIRITKVYVWSILLYGCECWTIDRDIENRLNAAEMWFLRRILRIPWTDRVSNDNVLARAGVQRELMKTVRKRQMSFLGHIYRKNDLEKAVLAGKICGRRDRGRQRITYLQSLNNAATGGSMSKTDFLRVAERREDWRLMIADVCNRPGT